MKIKPNKQIGSMVAAFVLVASLNSCIKDRNALGTDFTKIVNVVDLPVNGFKAIALEIKPNPETVKIYVELGGPLPGKDVMVTLALDTAAITAYNTANGTSYVPLATSSYTLPTPLIVTIKNGERLGSIDLGIISTKVDLSVASALAFKIIDAQGVAIANNLKSILYSVGVKNKYDGQYSLKIKTVGWDAYGIADGVTFTLASIGLVTASGNTVTFSGDFQPAFTTAGAQTAFGATRPILAFDLVSDKLLSVTNDPGVVDSRNRQFHINAAVTDSRYDAATKTVYAAYIMTQNGRPDQQIYDTLSYTGVRP
ncbi:MAG: DUF1735 domain-containing protein [Ferruginibacter sp.]